MPKILTLTDDEIAVLKRLEYTPPCGCVIEPDDIVVHREARPGVPINLTPTVNVRLECPECYVNWTVLVPWPIRQQESNGTHVRDSGECSRKPFLPSSEEHRCRT